MEQKKKRTDKMPCPPSHQRSREASTGGLIFQKKKRKRNPGKNLPTRCPPSPDCERHVASRCRGFAVRPLFEPVHSETWPVWHVYICIWVCVYIRVRWCMCVCVRVCSCVDVTECLQIQIQIGPTFCLIRNISLFDQWMRGALLIWIIVVLQRTHNLVLIPEQASGYTYIHIYL